MGSKITITTKSISVIILIFIPILVYSQNSRINIYSSGVYEIPYGDFRNPDIYPGKGNANDGASFNLGSQFKVYEKFFIGVESDYHKFGPRKKVANYEVYTSLYTFILNGSYYYQLNDFRPYALFGLGISATSLNVKTDFFKESSTQIVPFLNISLGCDMMVTEHAALFGLIRWSDALIEGRNYSYDHFQTLTPEFNASFIGFGAGIKFWIY
ncbi:MAG: hypothetical protein P8Y99_05075 [Calditrichaceae bacterium]